MLATVEVLKNDKHFKSFYIMPHSNTHNITYNLRHYLRLHLRHDLRVFIRDILKVLLRVLLRLNLIHVHIEHAHGGFLQA